MGLPGTTEFKEAVNTWLIGLPPGLSVPTILDLAYIEHRLGCWASPHLYGAAPFHMNLVPLCHRRIFDILLRLPPDYRRKQRLARDIISRAWPELMRWPFNDYTGFKRVRKHTKWFLQAPGRILARKLARLRARFNQHSE